jgi:hypothetical protein
MASDTTNIYAPLDPLKTQIRLVTLQPASSRKDVVRCDLSINSLDDPGRSPVYEALSYEWGFLKSASFIVLGGRRTQVRENLYQALIHLRHPENARTLWVDALCINQDDVNERSCQVQLMGRIFARAMKVLAWLGLDDEFTGIAMDLLLRAGSQHFAGDLRKLVDSDRPEYSLKHWAAFQHLCSMPYWDRLWISQEIALAREIEIHCGNFEISWNYLARTIKRLKSPILKATLSAFAREPLLQTMPVGLEEAQQVRDAGGGRSTQLCNLCHITHNALCSDPRDKVYGLLGIATHVGGRLQADYNKSLFEVFEDVMLLHSREVLKPKYVGFGMTKFAVILLNGFYRSVVKSTTLPEAANLKTLLRLPRVEKAPVVTVSIAVIGSIEG